MQWYVVSSRGGGESSPFVSSMLMHRLSAELQAWGISWSLRSSLLALVYLQPIYKTLKASYLRVLNTADTEEMLMGLSQGKSNHNHMITSITYSDRNPEVDTPLQCTSDHASEILMHSVRDGCLMYSARLQMRSTDQAA